MHAAATSPDAIRPAQFNSLQQAIERHVGRLRSLSRDETALCNRSRDWVRPSAVRETGETPDVWPSAAERADGGSVRHTQTGSYDRLLQVRKNGSLRTLRSWSRKWASSVIAVHRSSAKALDRPAKSRHEMWLEQFKDNENGGSREAGTKHFHLKPAVLNVGLRILWNSGVWRRKQDRGPTVAERVLDS